MPVEVEERSTSGPEELGDLQNEHDGKDEHEL